MRPRCGVETFSPEVKLESTASVLRVAARRDSHAGLCLLSALSYEQPLQLKSRNQRTRFDGLGCCPARGDCETLRSAS